MKPYNVKFYHVSHICGAVGEHWLVTDKQANIIQKFYTEEAARDFCDKLNAKVYFDFNTDK